MKVYLSLLLVILSLVGIADAAYLTYEKLSGIIPPCSPGFQCETVLTSEYASIGPIPLSVFGLGYYITIFLLAVLHFVEFDFSKNQYLHTSILRKSSPLDLLQIISSFGVLFSGYLVFIMGVVLEAWCLYCLISAVISTLIFITTQYYAATQTEKSSYLTKTIIHSTIRILYALFLKPLFFLLDPEDVHNRMLQVGSWMGQFGWARACNSIFFAYYDPSLKRTFNGITFPNPVGLSAGFDYNGRLTQILPAVGFGWHTIGTVTYQPYEGNPKPRLGRLPNSKALLVNKGLKNMGAHAVIQSLEQLTFDIPVGISIASTNTHFSDTKAQIMDIISCFSAFEKSKVQHDYYELNISCPNTFGGEPFTTPDRLQLLLAALDKLHIQKPIYVKMPIDQSESETIKLLAVMDKHRIAGVILGNLTKDKNNPAVTPEDSAVWKAQRGNLSGKPTFDRSNTLIALTRQRFGNRFTIVGTGGIFSPEDAQLKIQLGADLVQLITGMIYVGPQLIGSINRKLQ